MKFLFALGLTTVLLFGLVAQPAGAVSQAGGISLTFPVGSRYNALGEAGTALSTDQTAQWWNPGGFAFAADRGKPRGLHLMYTKLVPDLADDVFLTYLGYGQRIEGWGMLGLNLTYLDQGEQQGTDENGDPTDTFNSYQFAFGGTYGVKFADNLGVGMGLKYFRDELAPDNVTQDNQAGAGNSWAIDVGVHYKVLEKLDAGVTYANLGPDITFVDEAQADPMPQTLRMGLAYEAWHSPVQQVMLISDYLISMVQDDETKVVGLGAEWGYSGYLFLRLGYKSDPEGDIEGVTGGLGVDMAGLIDQSLTFDYANVPQAETLDTVHRFSLSWEF